MRKRQPEPYPGFSLVYPRQTFEAHTRALRRKFSVPNLWPPLGWETRAIPIELTVRAATQWFDFLVGGDQGELQKIEWLKWSEEVGTYVRDAWRLIRRLKAEDLVDIPEGELARRYSPHEAIIELSRLKELLSAPSRPVTRVTLEGRNVLVDGRIVQLPFTADKSDDAIAMLCELLKEPGHWKSSTDIGSATSKEGVRFDRVFKKLPNDIKQQLESNPRKGYRVRLA